MIRIGAEKMVSDVDVYGSLVADYGARNLFAKSI
jgi:hypothetical protein